MEALGELKLVNVDGMLNAHAVLDSLDVILNKSYEYPEAERASKLQMDIARMQGSITGELRILQSSKKDSFKKSRSKR